MPPTPPRSILTSLPNQLCFFILCCCYFKFTESICVALESGQSTSGHTIRENWPTLSQKLSNSNSSSAMVGIHACLPLPWWKSVWLEPRRRREIVQVLCLLSRWLWVYVSLSVLLCLEDSVFLKSSLPLDLTILLPSSGKFPKPCWGGVWYIHTFLGDEHTTVSYPLQAE